MKVKVNPINAVKTRHALESNTHNIPWELQKDPADLNQINTICHDTCKAFAGVTGLKHDYNRCVDDCAQLLSNKKCSIGKSDCTMLLPRRPVKWHQTEHFFPQELAHTKDLVTAEALCKQKCINYSSHPNECIRNCISDASSVNNVETFTSVKENRDDSDDSSKYCGCLLGGLIIALLITLFLVSWTKSPARKK